MNFIGSVQHSALIDRYEVCHKLVHLLSKCRRHLMKKNWYEYNVMENLIAIMHLHRATF